MQNPKAHKINKEKKGVNYYNCWTGGPTFMDAFDD